MQIPQDGVTTGGAVTVDVDPQQIAANVIRGWWRDRTIVDDLIDHAAQIPQKPAVIAHRAGVGVESLTYAELKDKVDRYAAALLTLGIRGYPITASASAPWPWSYSRITRHRPHSPT